MPPYPCEYKYALTSMQLTRTGGGNGATIILILPKRPYGYDVALIPICPRVGV